MSLRSSTAPTRSTDSDPMRRASVSSTSTNATSTSEFLAAVATEPPREEDYAGYPCEVVPESTVPVPRQIDEPSDELPSREKLVEASETPVLDGDGNEQPFKNLFLGGNCFGERRLILFIRHWYCRACQDYIKCLKDLVPKPKSSSKNKSSRDMPTRIILVGCGDPSLIKSYAQRTNCPYPIYTEPTLRLLNLLGCHRWGGVLWGFGRRPQYSKEHSAGYMATASLLDKYRSIYTDTLGNSPPACEATDSPRSSRDSRPVMECGLKKKPSFEGLRSGPIFQVGGEFLFEEGSLVWCHRMKGMRTHAEIKTLRRVLEMENEDETIEARLESKWIEQELQEHEVQGKRPSKELRRKAEKLSKTFEASEDTQKTLARPISDEEEDRYLDRKLGRKPSMATVQNGMRVMREPNSPRAHLVREEPRVKKGSTFVVEMRPRT